MSDPERIYDLLPAAVRVRDAEQGGPLAALLDVIQGELDRAVAGIEQLYDNWFVETCEEWVLPQLAELLGTRGVLAAGDARFSQRGLVANTLDYRRARGTAAVLEQLAYDLTGWPARVVESFARLVTTQHVNHVRTAAGATLEVRDADGAELAGGPFERATHVADVRHADSGRYNLPNVAIHLWRAQRYRVTRASARAIDGRPGRYTFDPLGLDVPLFNAPRAETVLEHLVEERDVPGPLRRRPLHDELTGAEGAVAWLGADEPVLEVRRRGRPAAAAIRICDLADPARRPPAGGEAIAVDPVLGRLALPADEPDAELDVTYAYGFGGDVGAGPYDRREEVAELLGRPPRVGFQAGVTRDGGPEGAPLYESLAGAIDAWAAWAAGRPPDAQGEQLGVIALMDSATYAGDLEIAVPAGHTLAIVAADWPTENGEPDGPLQPGRVVADERRPHVRGPLAVTGLTPTAGITADAGTLALDGLLVEGTLRVAEGDLGLLHIAHCTFAPAFGVDARERNHRLRIAVDRCIAGTLDATGADALVVRESVVDAGGGGALAGRDVTVDRSTLLGECVADRLSASDSIFTGRAAARRRQDGCVRYCRLAPGSVVARRYRCSSGVAPAFASLTPGRPGYAQLAPACPPEIVRGASDGGEMGAFNFLHRTQRLANLQSQLDEHLRLGLEAGVLFAT